MKNQSAEGGVDRNLAFPPHARYAGPPPASKRILLSPGRIPTWRLRLRRRLALGEGGVEKRIHEVSVRLP